MCIYILGIHHTCALMHIHNHAFRTDIFLLNAFRTQARLDDFQSNPAVRRCKVSQERTFCC